MRKFWSLMKPLLLRICFIFSGLIFGLLITEGALWLLNSTKIINIDPQKSFANDPFIYSSTLKYTVKPYLTRECTAPGNPKAICYANKFGHRDTDHNFEKKQHTFRVLLLGDSMTYGPGVNFEESYPGIFEHLVKKKNKTDKNIEIIKMGMVFYGPEQYYNMYKELGKKYDPDLIILSFHLLTDPYDAYEFNANRRFYKLKALPEKIPYPINQQLKEKSFLWRTALSAYYSWANKQEVKVFEKVFKGKNNRFQYDTQLNVHSEFMQQGWKLAEQNVNKIVIDAKKENTSIAVIGFSLPVQVDPDYWKKMRSEGLLSDKKLYESSPARKKFLEICEKNKWLCLELQEDLRRAHDPSKLFLKGDIHYTKEGNIITANSIYNFLINEKLLN